MPWGEQLDDGDESRAVVFPVRPVGSRQLVDQARPCLRGGKRRIDRQDSRPALGQVRERAGVATQQCVQSPHSRLGEAAQQDIRESRRSLPLAARRDLDAVHEVQVEAGVGAEREKVVVVVGRRGRRDGDLGGLRPAGGEELPHPAHGLDRLVIGRGRADGGDIRRLRVCPHNLDRLDVEPVRHRAGACDPAHGHMAGERVQQRPPDGRELRNTDDFDRPEQRRRMLQPRAPRSDEVGGPHHRRRQRPHDLRLQAGDRVKARMLAGTRLKVHAGAPRLAQRVSGGAHHAGELLDPVELAQRRLRQHSRDGLPEHIVIDRLRQPAREPRRQLLEGHDLQPVPPPPRRLEPQFPHPEQAVGDYRVSNNCFCAHDASPGRSETELI